MHLTGKNAPFTFSYDISGVPATFAVTHHANQVNVIVSQTGAVGTVIHAEADSSIAGVATEDTTFTVKVLLGYASVIQPHIFVNYSSTASSIASFAYFRIRACFFPHCLTVRATRPPTAPLRWRAASSPA